MEKNFAGLVLLGIKPTYHSVICGDGFAFAEEEKQQILRIFNMKPDELPEFIGETGHFSTIFDFSAHTLTDGEHGWYDAPKLEFAKWRAAIIQEQ